LQILQRLRRVALGNEPNIFCGPEMYKEWGEAIKQADAALAKWNELQRHPSVTEMEAEQEREVGRE
jgi:hypothetical protein